MGCFVECSPSRDEVAEMGAELGAMGSGQGARREAGAREVGRVSDPGR